MAYTAHSFDSEHQGTINEIKFDYYGKRLATTGLDGKIQIFELSSDNNQKKVAEIVGHENAVWSLSWSHPRFGSLLASSGFDKKVYIWKDTGKNWEKLFEYTHGNSVNCVTFAPQEYGLILMCGSSDGTTSLHEYKNENWNSHKIIGHSFGVNAVSWGPCSESLNYMRFVSVGMDNLIRVWQAKDTRLDSFYLVTTLEAHEDAVRDVAWRYSQTSTFDVIASGGDDNTVFLWINTNGKNQNESGDENSNNASQWTKFELRKFSSPISKLAWDESGNNLAVTTNEAGVYIFNEISEGQWDLVSLMNSDGVIVNCDEISEENK